MKRTGRDGTLVTRGTAWRCWRKWLEGLVGRSGLDFAQPGRPGFPDPKPVATKRCPVMRLGTLGSFFLAGVFAQNFSIFVQELKGGFAVPCHGKNDSRSALSVPQC